MLMVERWSGMMMLMSGTLGGKCVVMENRGERRVVTKRKVEKEEGSG
jgi:hypothetical protein